VKVKSEAAILETTGKRHKKSRNLLQRRENILMVTLRIYGNNTYGKMRQLVSVNRHEVKKTYIVNYDH